ncbi:WD40/YVTN/BNR-like repeat-containing protein [candidate division KSB1 bacterium]
MAYMKKGYLSPMVLKITFWGDNWDEISIKPSVSGSPFSLAFDHLNPDLIYLGFEYLRDKRGIVFRSIDGGDTWTELPMNFNIKSDFSKIVVSPLISLSRKVNFVYISTFEGIFKSADTGETWKRICSNRVTDFCLTESGCLIALLNNDLICSEDDGKNWETVYRYGMTDNPEFHQLYLDENNKRIFIAGAKGLFTGSFNK